MNSIFKLMLSLLVILVLAGCAATVPMGTEAQDRQAKSFIPLEGKGSLYVHRHEFFRIPHLFGLTVNGMSLGQVSAGSYVQLNLNPGKYIVQANAQESAVQSEVVIEAGKNSFLWLEAKIGVMNGSRCELHDVTDEFGKNSVLKSKKTAIAIPESRITPF